MKASTKTTLEKVTHTLGLITICGRENMDMLLGCILTLEKITSDPEEQEKEEQEKREEATDD